MPNHPTTSGSTVLAFAGHMIDSPGRAKARFPASAEGVVAASIARVLDEYSVAAAVTSLASGADLILAELLLARGGEVHAVLPLSKEDFLNASVRPTGDASWERRFEDVFARSTTVEIHGDDYLSGSGSPFQMAALLIDGGAQLLAGARGSRGLSLVVWDGLAGDGLGGTASFAGHAVEQGRTTLGIHPLDGERFVPGPEALSAAQRHSWASVQAGEALLEHRLVSVLFADAKGFGGLRETQMPAFIREVLGVVRRALAGMHQPAIAVNTWGDGLFVVTAAPAQCAGLALALIDGAKALDWRAAGLPGEVAFRVGLHCGPAFVTMNDPIVGRANAFGRDVSLTARIEPVAALNEAWCSRAFAVMAAATGCPGITFADLGVRDLAKGAGRMHLYRVGR